MVVKRKTIAVVFGTRPDAIKLAPIILALKRERQYFNVVTIATAQHRKMLDQVLRVFKIKPDYDLNTMRPRQTLAAITKSMIQALDQVFSEATPDLVLVQGDTTTTFVASLAAFYRGIPVGHVEAGLRTNDKAQPFPEEINRRLTTSIADLHFAPTTTAKKALLREHVDPKSICVTGNSGIDALRIAVKRRYKFSMPFLNEIGEKKARIILITIHRRENLGAPMLGAVRAIRQLALLYPECQIIFPVHLNPAVRQIVYPVLGNVSNVRLVEPLDYMDFVNLMAISYLIITDSGGVQEEGPSLGKPVLVLRGVTERPEAVASGIAMLVGLDQVRIVRTARKLIDSKQTYNAMAKAINPYGDGIASVRTVSFIKRYFGLSGAKTKEFNPGA